MIQKEVIREILLENRKEVEFQQIVPRNFQMEDFANYVLMASDELANLSCSISRFNKT